MLMAAEYAQRSTIWPISILHIVKCTAAAGPTIRPTRRSVTARQLYRSFDGELRDDSLRSAARITAFPRTVAIERKTYIVEKKNVYPLDK